VNSVDVSATELSPYELMRLEREEAFDAKIAQLKEEIALVQDGHIYGGLPAEELHPDVRNLPHKIVPSHLVGSHVEEVAR